jgi:1-acyl-sn-glycerol-3-phosphate acyltransferase
VRSPALLRLLVGPLILAVEFGLLVFAPFLAAASAVLSLFFGGRRPVRVLALVLAWASTHLSSVGACVVLARAGHGPHYGVMRWFVGALARAALRVARVTVLVRGSHEAEAALAPDRPVIVLSIHSGEGDSLLVLDHLLRHHRRRPRIVMHQALALDPLIGVIGRRLPNRFVDPRGGDIEREIEAMSRDLGARDAVVIFPEGGNVTAERRKRAIERLLRRGHTREARTAEAMRHLGAPRPGGALAALQGAGTADVVFFAHHGFPVGMGAAWNDLPRPTRVEIELWHVPASEIPAGQDAQIEWLFEWWAKLDAWVGAQASSTATRGAAGRVR